MVASDDSANNPIVKLIGDMYEMVFVKKKKITSWVAFFMILGLTFLVFNAEAKEKADDMLGRSQILDILGGRGGDSGFTSNELKDRIEVQEKSSITNELQEGSSDNNDLLNSQVSILSGIDIKLNWQDEEDKPGLPRIRRYTNEPDTFSVIVKSPNGTIIETAESNTGSISIEIGMEEEEMLENIDAGDYQIEIKLVTAGDWVASTGPSVLTYRDDSNSYDLIITAVYLEVEQE